MFQKVKVTGSIQYKLYRLDKSMNLLEYFHDKEMQAMI